MWYRLLVLSVFLCNYGIVVAYKAAVFEYSPLTGETSQKTIENNLECYRTYVNKARDQSADIVIFPEYGLTSVVSDPEKYAIEQNDPIFQNLSNIARDHNLYLVVNLITKINNGGQAKYFNTDLVFSRNGSIEVEYRKINVHNEANVTPGPTDQNPIFTTDFGVTFGIFTGTDIFFSNPQTKILQNNSVTDIIVPTSWVSKMPFFVSLSVQHGYAQANGVNLLVANYGKPKDGRGGSGIYLADGKIAETYIGDTLSTKPLVQEIPKKTKREPTNICSNLQSQGLPGDTKKSNVSEYLTEKLFDASKYQFENVNLTQDTSSITVCSRNDQFCCTFKISLNPNQKSDDIYKVAAYDGEILFDQVKVHSRICSLLACENHILNSCGARVNTTAVFRKITVEGNLPKDKSAFYWPLTVNTYLLPSQKVKFCDNNNGTDTSFVQLSSEEVQKNVLVFGLFGRTDQPVKPEKGGNGDNDDNGDNGGNGTSSESLVRFVLYLALVLFVFG